jgi:hypothetical protein
VSEACCVKSYQCDCVRQRERERSTERHRTQQSNATYAIEVSFLSNSSGHAYAGVPTKEFDRAEEVHQNK